jgi:ribosome recycling factor
MVRGGSQSLDRRDKIARVDAKDLRNGAEGDIVVFTMFEGRQGAMSIEEIVLEAEERMEKSLALLGDQLRGIRTGRANVGLVDSIRVEYYGSPTPLKQMANLSTPEPQQILIRPFDPSVVSKVVRLNVPPLSVEQRKKLSNRVKELAEEARVAIRNIRRDANKQAELEQGEKILTEDDLATCKEEIQNLTKQYETKVNELAEKKSAEIMEV